jgi:hypothetical protein
VDFPSSLPLVASFKIVAFAQGADEGDESGNMPLLRAIKLIRLARILKLIRLMKARLHRTRRPSRAHMRADASAHAHVHGAPPSLLLRSPPLRAPPRDGRRQRSTV